MYVIWSDQFHLLSIITPKTLVLLTPTNGKLSDIYNEKKGSKYGFLRDSIYTFFYQNDNRCTQQIVP